MSLKSDDLSTGAVLLFIVTSGSLLIGGRILPNYWNANIETIPIVCYSVLGLWVIITLSCLALAVWLAYNAVK